MALRFLRAKARQPRRPVERDSQFILNRAQRRHWVSNMVSASRVVKKLGKRLIPHVLLLVALLALLIYGNQLKRFAELQFGNPKTVGQQLAIEAGDALFGATESYRSRDRIAFCRRIMEFNKNLELMVNLLQDGANLPKDALEAYSRVSFIAKSNSLRRIKEFCAGPEPDLEHVRAEAIDLCKRGQLTDYDFSCEL
jgi:hypothetical protein